MHFHIRRGTNAITAVPKGCVISRSLQENSTCLEFARKNHVASALFADPASPEWKQLVDLVFQKSVLTYRHFEDVGSNEIHLLDPLLAASEQTKLPVILHVSRHDAQRFDSREALKCLHYVLEKYPALEVIVAHLGGENCLSLLSSQSICERVYLDTSCGQQTAQRAGLSGLEELLSRVYDAVPATRLIYGSDRCFPEDRPVDDTATILTRSLSAKDAAFVFEANGNRILEALESRPC